MKVPSTNSPRDVRYFMIRRREARYEVDLSVKVWGMDRYGKPFVQQARTLDASPVGARLNGIDCVGEGEIIAIQHGNQKSRFQVVWVGRDHTPKAGQIGVQSLEPGKPLFVAGKRPKVAALTHLIPQFRSGMEPLKRTRPVEAYARNASQQKKIYALPLQRRSRAAPY